MGSSYRNVLKKLDRHTAALILDWVRKKFPTSTIKENGVKIEVPYISELDKKYIYERYGKISILQILSFFTTF